jgi:hypothetical protein
VSQTNEPREGSLGVQEMDSNELRILTKLGLLDDWKGKKDLHTSLINNFVHSK